MSFAAPANTGGGVKPADLHNHLLIITPLEYRTGITTSMGDSDAIAVDIVDLDTNEEHDNSLLFNPALRNALKPLLGQKVLAKIVQGVAKPGKTAPWILQDMTVDTAAVARATAYLAGGLNAPSAPTPTPAAAPVPAPAAPAGIDLNDPTIQALMAQLGATKA